MSLPLRRLGANYPTRLHSRDAAINSWGSATAADVNTICGAIVSGPWVDPAAKGTKPEEYDLYNNNRDEFQETEAALDYSASVLCAFAGYAAMPAKAFDHCLGVRGPLAGRVAASGSGEL
jgi:N-acetylglucosamine-6-phosphate deacetylase